MKAIKLSDLTPDPNNANKGTVRGRGLLEKSLQDLGAGRSILVDKNNVAIAGNKSLQVAIESGFEDAIVVESDGTKLIVVKRTDLDLSTDEKAKLLAIADNRVGEISLEWSPEVLTELSQEVDLSGFFFPDELEALLAAEPPDPVATAEEDEATAADLAEKAEAGELESRVSLGQIWACGRHRVACADSTVEANVKGLLGDRAASMVWSDPPYGISIVATNVTVGGGEAYDIPFGGVKNREKGYVGGGNCNRTSIAECRQRKEQGKKSEGLGSTNGAKPFGSKNADVRGTDGASNIVAVNKYAPIIGDDTVDTAIASSALCLGLYPDAVQFWWGGNYYAESLPNSSCWVIWDKENTGNFADAELAWTNQPTAVRIFKHMWNGMVKASERGQRRVHPTQKPIALAEWCFEKYGKADDLILDPFLGSGMSLIAAQQMEGDTSKAQVNQRTVYGFELSEAYCEVVLRRYEAFTGQTAELVGNL